MKKFWGYASNNKFSVGCTGQTVFLYDKNGNELGKFKIEHVFTEIGIYSSRKFVATLEDGTHFIHCPKKDINYDEFIENVKNNKYTTKLTI